MKRITIITVALLALCGAGYSQSFSGGPGDGHSRHTTGVVSLAAVPSGIDNGGKQLQAKVFPNPCRDYVFVTTDENIQGSVTLNLYDVTGKSVINETVEASQEIRLSLNDIDAGIYFLRMRSGKLFCNKTINVKQ